jgi:hypothetical protein
MSERVSGQAVCAVCGWAATITADDLPDLGQSIRNLILRHMAAAHPEAKAVSVVTHNHTEPMTHYCDWDVPGKRQVRAICGELIQRRDHTNEPTCPNCQAELAERARSVGP